MPHQCTNCGRVFADGSKEMLSGCPNCGGNKFQFDPSGSGSDGAAQTTNRRQASSSDTTPSGRAADHSREATGRESASTGNDTARTESASSTDDDAAGSTTWRRAASRAAEADDGGRPDTRSHDGQPRSDDQTNDVDSAARRGQTLREWANSRGFASEVEDANDETTLRENRRRTGDAQRRRSERPDEQSPPGTTESSSSASTSPNSPPSNSSPPESTPSDSSPSETGPSTSPSESTPPASTPPSDSAASPSPSPEASSADPADPSVFGDDTEDDAQASARSEVVSPDEIRAASERPPDAEGTVIEPQSDERPDLDDLREELNDQFESIKIVAPGEYELNLMELYDRPEYIISLREDGRYVIEVPDTWGSHDDDR